MERHVAARSLSAAWSAKADGMGMWVSTLLNSYSSCKPLEHGALTQTQGSRRKLWLH